MSREWTGSVRINAWVEAVYAYLADFTRHPEWDASTTRVTQLKPCHAAGVGAEYRAYERLDLFGKTGEGKGVFKNQAGVTDREAREMVHNRRIAWHSHLVPRIGVTAEYAFEFEPDGDGTRLSETIAMNAPLGLDRLQQAIFRGTNEKQQAEWQENLERIKAHVKQVAAPEPALAAR